MKTAVPSTKFVITWQLADGLEQQNTFYHYSNARLFLTTMTNEFDGFMIISIKEYKNDILLH